MSRDNQPSDRQNRSVVGSINAWMKLKPETEFDPKVLAEEIGLPLAADLDAWKYVSVNR